MQEARQIDDLWEQHQKELGSTDTKAQKENLTNWLAGKNNVPINTALTLAKRIDAQTNALSSYNAEDQDKLLEDQTNYRKEILEGIKT